jgi:hypothetical protein
VHEDKEDNAHEIDAMSAAVRTAGVAVGAAAFRTQAVVRPGASIGAPWPR